LPCSIVAATSSLGAWSGSSDGIYHHDTRYLSRIELRLNSAPLLLLSSNVEDDNAVLTVDLDNPGMVSRGLRGELVHVKLGKFSGTRPNQEAVPRGSTASLLLLPFPLS